MKNILIFLSGAAVGSVVTWKLLEKKYKNIADEEIKSVVDTFRKKEESLDIREDKIYKEEVEQYNKESDYVEENKKDTVPETIIIADSQFGEYEDYETKSYIYYDDGIVADANTDEILKEPNIILGDALMHFNDDPNEEEVFVRNESKKIDYEILRSEKTYSEIVGTEEQ